MNSIWRLILLAIVIIAGCDSNSPGEAQSPLAGVPSIPISAQFDPLSGAELDSFAGLIGRARIVAIGESRHDTSEQFALRALLTRNLVEDFDFRVIVLEESFSHAMALDAYVTTGEGDLRSVLNALAGWYLWDTEEMVDFLTWVRQFNETVPADDMIRISGMDITAPAQGIRHAVQVADSLDSSADWAEREYGLGLHAGDFWPQILGRYADLPETDEERIRRNLKDLADFLEIEAREAESAADLRVAAIEAAIGRRAHDMFSSEGIAQIGEMRERGMADVVDWIISENGVTASTIVWTHNLHAATTQFRMPEMAEGYLTPLGVLLRESYGAYYVAIGATFGSGEYEEGSPPGGRVFERPGPETIDGALSQTGPPAVLVDLASLDESSPAIEWLSQEREWRMQDSVAILSASDGFDGIYYVERISRATLTPLARQKHGMQAD